MRHFSDDLDGMRLLMADELDLIAGGEGEDTDDVVTEIEVRGHKYTTIVDYDPSPLHDINVGNGDGSPPPDPTKHYKIAHPDDDDCKQGAALKIADHINGLLQSFPGNEFGTVLINNGNGTYGANQDKIETDFKKSNTSLTSPDDWHNAVGIVHDHPLNTADYNDNFQQRYPSNDDWNQLDKLKGNGADPNNLSLFIIDPWGVTREFKYSDKDMYKNLNTTDRNRGEFLPDQIVDCTPST